VKGGGLKQMSPEDLDAYFSQSNLLWGLMPKTFVYVGIREPQGNLTLHKAIQDAEYAGNDASFLLVGYQDGGLISVSNRKLAFQAEAQPADWWQI